MWDLIRNNPDLLRATNVTKPVLNRLFNLSCAHYPTAQFKRPYTLLGKLLIGIALKNIDSTNYDRLNHLNYIIEIGYENDFNRLCDHPRELNINTVYCSEATYNKMQNKETVLGQNYAKLVTPKVLTKWFNKKVKSNYLIDIGYTEETIIFFKKYPRKTELPNLALDIATFLIVTGWLKTIKIYKPNTALDALIKSYTALDTYAGKSDAELIEPFLDWLAKYHSEYAIDYDKDIINAFKPNNTEKIKRIQDSINNNNNEINRYSETINTLIEQIRDWQLKIDYLNNAKDNNEIANNMLHVLKNYKPIVSYEFNTDQQALFYTVVNNMKVSNPEAWKRNISNRDISTYAKKLLSLALTEDDVNIKTSFTFRIPANRNVDVSYRPASPELPNGTIRHPHLFHYRCYGNNTPILNECYREQDYAAMVEQTIEIVANLNWADAPVVTRFIDDVIYEYRRERIFEYKGITFSLEDFTEGEEIYEIISKEYPDA